MDTDFVQSQVLADSYDIRLSLSCAGYIIKVANCLICWISKIEFKVILSTTKAEYIALSQSTRDLIQIKNIVEYLN